MALGAGANGSSTSNGSGGSSRRRLVLFFRNDLRLHDNYIVHEAVKMVQAKQCDEVLPVYCFDPRFFAITPWGNLKTGAFRAKFQLESVVDLKRGLRSIGSDLLVAVGRPEDVIPGLLEGSSTPLVLTQQEVTSEELAVDTALSRALEPLRGRLQKFWGATMYHLDDLQGPNGPFNGASGVRGMPDVFTPFREKCEKRVDVRKEVPTPGNGQLPLPPGLTAPTTASSAPKADTAVTAAAAAAAAALAPRAGGSSSTGAAPAGSCSAPLQQLLEQWPSWEGLPWPAGVPVPEPPKLHPSAVLDFKGGEAAALARLKHYLWDSDAIASYFDTRNGMLGADFSTKFAPWLAHGCLSPRTIYQQIRKYEAQRTSNKSTYWVLFELIWRDFFRFYALKHGRSIFFEGGPIGKRLPWSPDPELFKRWCEGRTGQPLVDANMRELKATGFMSNRGRQNVASYLVLDLGVDWRKGADWFESLLLDYDVASNWGNWVAAAGLTGGRINHFNITKQSKDYDLAGDYIRTWLPELRNVPVSRIHEPWLMSKEEQARCGVQIGVDYPTPISASRYARPHEAYATSGSSNRYNNRGSGPEGRSAGGRGGSGGRPFSGSKQTGQNGAGNGSRTWQKPRARVSDFERFG